MPRQPLRRLGQLLCSLAIAVLILFLTAWLLLRASLPRLDGEQTAQSLTQAVSVVRDDRGVPTIEAASAKDASFALGYLHAQERFFQMDLLRRAAAGELAALIGEAGLDNDRANRIHRFRARAESALADLSPTERERLGHYVAGVNAGLESLQVWPFEYLLLRQRPQRWQEADSLLVIYAMYFDLQGEQVRREAARGLVAARCMPDMLPFLLPESSVWDAPLDAPHITSPLPPLPEAPPDGWRGHLTQALRTTDHDHFPGSNAWVVGGGQTASGAALLANDMHLSLRLPNLWYRAMLRFPNARGEHRQLVGVTLPGLPTVIAGSNGDVAWGFTNSYGDYVDLIDLEFTDEAETRYLVPDNEDEALTRHTVDLAVAHDTPERLTIEETRWGPVWRTGEHAYAVRWLAHDRGAANLGLLAMEDAKTVEDALAVGARAGMPTQNLMVAGRDGRVAWSLAGPLPKRPWPGTHNTLPQVGYDPHVGWSDHLAPDAYPKIIRGKDGRLWSANNRQLAGDDYAKIGDGGPDIGVRAQRIRDTLAALPPKGLTERDMLTLQLDTQAPMLEPWRARLLRRLDAAALAGKPARAAAKAAIEAGPMRADVDAIGYRIVRDWRERLQTGLTARFDADLADEVPGLSYRIANTRWDSVLTRLLDEQPAAWLPPGHADWPAFELAMLDAVLDDLSAHGGIARARWGDHNRADITHPFARLLPSLKHWLAAPADALPGDTQTVRAQAPSFGASERMVVAPGQEALGLFQMPGGQSGHPLSPYFLAGHADWVSGRPAPLIPGAAAHRLTLKPVR